MKNLSFALLLLLASCTSDHADLQSLMHRKTTEAAQTRETEDDGHDSSGTSIGIVMDSADFEEEEMVVSLGW